MGEPLRGHEDCGHQRRVLAGRPAHRLGLRDNTLRLWDAATGQPLGEPCAATRMWSSSVAFSPDGQRIVSGSWDKTLRLWDAATGQPVGEPLRGHEDRGH